jgi:hypothetical protein
MELADIEMLCKAWTPVLKEWIAPLLARLDGIERRMAAVETRGLCYRGVHQRAETYSRGDATTYDGSLFIAVVDDPKDAPGTGGGWVLAVKRGRDAK